MLFIIFSSLKIPVKIVIFLETLYTICLFPKKSVQNYLLCLQIEQFLCLKIVNFFDLGVTESNVLAVRVFECRIGFVVMLGFDFLNYWDTFAPSKIFIYEEEGCYCRVWPSGRYYC